MGEDLRRKVFCVTLAILAVGISSALGPLLWAPLFGFPASPILAGVGGLAIGIGAGRVIVHVWPWR